MEKLNIDDFKYYISVVNKENFFKIPDLSSSIKPYYPDFFDWLQTTAKNRNCVVLKYKDQFIGYIIYKPVKITEDKYNTFTVVDKVFKICSIFISEPYRKQHLGKFMMIYLLKSIGLFDGIYVTVKNKPELKYVKDFFTKKFGFEKAVNITKMKEKNESVYVYKSNNPVDINETKIV